LPTLSVVTRRDPGLAWVTRHWVDVVSLPGGRTALTAGAIATTVPHVKDLVGWLIAESHTGALLDRPPDEALARLGGLLGGTAAHTAAAAYLVHNGPGQSITLASAGYGTMAVVAPDGSTDIVARRTDRTLSSRSSRHEPVSLPFPVGSALVLHAHTPTCPSSGPSEEVLQAEIAETRLYAHGATSLGAVCEALAQTLRCDDERDESIVVVATADDGGTGDHPRRSFAGRPDSAAAARSFTLRAMDEWKLVRAGNRAAAIVGELAANAVQHAETPFEVRLHRHAATITLEVIDRGRQLPQAVHTGRYEAGQRGLLIVETLADRWGIRFTDHGKAVWAEMRIDPPAEAPRPEGPATE